MQSLQSSAANQVVVQVAFSIYAPGKKNVSVFGEFTHSQHGLRLRPSRSGWWRARVALPAGRYRYRLTLTDERGEKVTVADPLSTQVEWDGNGEAWSILDLQSKPFEWTDREFETPVMNELMLYELHVGDFTRQGTFAAATQKLDYLRDLGINAVELMPITEFARNGDWGYEPLFYMAPECDYGTPADLKRFVNEAHRRGIAVILDMVFNHCGHDNPLNRIYPYDENPYFGTGQNPYALPDFDHWHAATKRLFWDVQKYWLTEFHIDGFRYDHTEGINFDQANGVQYLAAVARATKPNVLLISENMKNLTADVLHTPVHAQWHEPFCHKLRPQICERDIGENRYGDMQGLWEAISFGLMGYRDHAQAINYVENHDHERLPFYLRDTAELRDGAAIMAKLKIACVTLMTACGVPMLYAGQEFGTDNRKVIERSKLPWEYLDTDEGAELRAFFKQAIELRRRNGALKVNAHDALVISDQDRIIVFKRWDDHGNELVIALNFSNKEITVPITISEGRWREWFSGNELDGGSIGVILPISGAQVWVKQ